MVDWKALHEEHNADANKFYIVLAGDKGFKRDKFITVVLTDKVTTMNAMDAMTLIVDKLLRDVVVKYEEVRVTVGDNTGADEIATAYAMLRDYDIYKYEADWDGAGNKAGFERNEQMFINVGRRPHKAALLFWDGKDYMTRNLIYQAYNYCVPVKVYNYEEKRMLTQDEIKSVQEDERQKQMKFMKT